MPYLEPVETEGEDKYPQYASTVSLTKENIQKLVKEKFEDIEINMEEKNMIEILEKNESGRVKTLRVGNKEITRSRGKNIIWIKVNKF